VTIDLIQKLELAGDHYTLGRQHGGQVRHLRAHILAGLKNRLDSLAKLPLDLQPFLAEMAGLWWEINRPTVKLLQGMAETLDFEWEPFFRYTLASYLADRAFVPTASQGCTVWAAGDSITRSGEPMLVKNRDYRLDHLNLQCLAQVRPSEGYGYTCVTSAGSPGVFSSGMNETGLAVADTHVSSKNMGPGLARYSAMMEVLERYNNVPCAVDFLRQVPHIGDGTIVLLDAWGEMAVFEAGHGSQGIVRPDNGFVVSTNHYVTSGLRHEWIDQSRGELHGNTQGRYQRIYDGLASNEGKVDLRWAQQLMSSHGTPMDAICRHPEVDPQSVTISTVIYLPKERLIYLANGQPCQNELTDWKVG
jgi:hypothetical protein